MGFKSFITKTALRAKGVSKDEAERIAAELEAHPEIVDAMKKLEGNKEVKELLEKIQKEIEEKTKAGMNEMYASTLVMGKYKGEMMKYREEIAPLLQLMMRK